MSVRTGIAPTDLLATPTIVLQEMRAILLEQQKG
jgi:hypothetical protein